MANEWLLPLLAGLVGGAGQTYAQKTFQDINQQQDINRQKQMVGVNVNADQTVATIKDAVSRGDYDAFDNEQFKQAALSAGVSQGTYEGLRRASIARARELKQSGSWMRMPNQTASPVQTVANQVAPVPPVPSAPPPVPPSMPMKSPANTSSADTTSYAKVRDASAQVKPTAPGEVAPQATTNLPAQPPPQPVDSTDLTADVPVTSRERQRVIGPEGSTITTSPLDPGEMLTDEAFAAMQKGDMQTYNDKMYEAGKYAVLSKASNPTEIMQVKYMEAAQAFQNAKTPEEQNVAKAVLVYTRGLLEEVRKSPTAPSVHTDANGLVWNVDETGRATPVITTNGKQLTAHVPREGGDTTASINKSIVLADISDAREYKRRTYNDIKQLTQPGMPNVYVEPEMRPADYDKFTPAQKKPAAEKQKYLEFLRGYQGVVETTTSPEAQKYIKDLDVQVAGQLHLTPVEAKALRDYASGVPTEQEKNEEIKAKAHELSAAKKEKITAKTTYKPNANYTMDR